VALQVTDPLLQVMLWLLVFVSVTESVSVPLPPEALSEPLMLKVPVTLPCSFDPENGAEPLNVQLPDWSAIAPEGLPSTGRFCAFAFPAQSPPRFTCVWTLFTFERSPATSKVSP
jgi:hypothetical protein